MKTDLSFDLFKNKELVPMLMHRSAPFDSGEHIFELKHDGARCLAFIDGSCEIHSGDTRPCASVYSGNIQTASKSESNSHCLESSLDVCNFGGVRLQSRNQMDLTAKFPELCEVAGYTKSKLILDCELIVPKSDRASFTALLSRLHKQNSVQIARAARSLPSQLIIFDILYIDGNDLTKTPLLERKEILSNSFREGSYAIIARYIKEKGISFFSLTQKHNLEGIVAKNIHSHYFFGKRTHEWLKIKNADFIRT